MDTSLQASFRLSGKGVVSIVGAGGKTTVMFRLAKELSAMGSSVLTVTTTKIFCPAADLSPLVLIDSDPVELVRRADAFFPDARHLTAAAGIDRANGKLLGYSPEAIDLFYKSGRFQWILVEADGAAGKSLKAPAAHEPVIPGETTVLVAVAGLDEVGHPLTEERVFRPHLYSRITGCSPGETITSESIYHALTHPEGIMKGCPKAAEKFVFLSSAQMPFPREIGREVGEMLLQGDRVHISGVLMGNIGNYHMEMESLVTSEALSDKD